jgi:enoyl-CoA hydratase/carnithine racemase
MPAEPPSSGGRLLVEEDGPALIVRISNPGRANALDRPVLDAMASLLHAPPPAARAVLLGGEGDRHFSAGLDVGGRGADEAAEALRDGERRLGAAAAAVADCPVPVIGVLNGAAFGGALELAIACDWRIARAGARLGMPAARIGVVYAPEGLRRFTAAMGPGQARRLFLTGAPVEAEEARAMGLVERVVEPEGLWAAARTAAAEIAAAAPLAVAGTRAVVRALTDGSAPADVEEVARRWRERAYASADFREGVAAFRERRPPEFTGR